MRQLLFFIALVWGALANAADPLPVKTVFVPEVHQSASDGQYVTTVTIHFPARYYLYADKTSLTSETPAESAFPPSEEKNDPYLGKVQVWHTPPTLTLTSDAPLTVATLKTQGCEENVICYPPTTWQLTVPAPSPAPENAAPKPATNLKKLFGAQNEVLAVEEAFRVDVMPTANGAVDVHFEMPAGYYLYQQSLAATLDGETIALNLPAGENHHDEYRGEQTIYRAALEFSLPLPVKSSAQTLVLHWQGCAEGRVCYPPQERAFTIPALGAVTTITPPPAVTIATINPAPPTGGDEYGIIKRLNDNFLIALALIVLLGIGVSFTACVYPLVPIVTSLVVGKNTTTRRAYALVGVYVIAMGAAMGLLGAIFGIFEVNLQLVLQKPWVVVLVALLFVGLSLSLFDVYTLQAPRWLQNPIDKITRQQQSGSYAGAAVMGALSVLVVSPCATPVLTSLLLFTTQTTPLKGALALFFFGLGTGLPLFLFAGAFRQFMPKAGSWMNDIKKLFAFALLAIAVFLVTRIMPLALALVIWAGFALFFAVFWFDATSKKRLFLAGLGGLAAIALAVHSLQVAFPVAAPNFSAAAPPPTQFRALNTAAEIEQAIATSEKPVLLDFYADWCVSCQKWEREIWHNPEFAAPLADYALLKIDVTDFNAAHKAIFQKLGLIGPPAVLVYPPHGTMDQPRLKIIGEKTPQEFAALLTELARK